MADLKKKSKYSRFSIRFSPKTTLHRHLLLAGFILSSFVLGAGLFAYFGRLLMHMDPYPWAFWSTATGCLLFALTLWFSTGNGPALRIGASGIALDDHGEFVCIPWHAVRAISTEGEPLSLVVEGRDESGLERSFRIYCASHPQASHYLVQEARARIPKKLSVPERFENDLPPWNEVSGIKVTEVLQVVGKKCHLSEVLLRLEVEAAVCPRCDLIFHKDHVPDVCECGYDAWSTLRSHAEISTLPSEKARI